MGLTGVAGIVGGYWKSYNDIPSLVGYMSMALIVYKLSTGLIVFSNILTRYRMSGILSIY